MKTFNFLKNILFLTIIVFGLQLMLLVAEAQRPPPNFLIPPVQPPTQPPPPPPPPPPPMPPTGSTGGPIEPPPPPPTPPRCWVGCRANAIATGCLPREAGACDENCRKGCTCKGKGVPQYQGQCRTLYSDVDSEGNPTDLECACIYCEYQDR